MPRKLEVFGCPADGSGTVNNFSKVAFDISAVSGGHLRMSKASTPSTLPQPVMVLLADLDLAGSPQVRARLNHRVVKEYAAAMRRGDEFPPIDAFRVNGAILVSDGGHRCEAAKRCGLSAILAVVREGTMKEAVRHALQANTTHGLRRTNADKRQAVELAFKTFGPVSDRTIAVACAVSQAMVWKLRPQLTDSVSSPNRVGRDGKTRRMPRRAAQPSPAPPTASVANFRVADWVREDGADRVARAFRAAARVVSLSGMIPATPHDPADPDCIEAEKQKRMILAMYEELPGVCRLTGA